MGLEREHSVLSGVRERENTVCWVGLGREHSVLGGVRDGRQCTEWGSGQKTGLSFPD